MYKRVFGANCTNEVGGHGNDELVNDTRIIRELVPKTTGVASAYERVCIGKC